MIVTVCSAMDIRRRSSVDHHYNIGDIICDCGRPCTITAHDGDDSVTRRGRQSLRGPLQLQTSQSARDRSEPLPPYRRQSLLTIETSESQSLKEIKTEGGAPRYLRRSSLFGSIGSATKATGAPCESRREISIRYGPPDCFDDDDDFQGPITPTEEDVPEFAAVNWNQFAEKNHVGGSVKRLPSRVPPDSHEPDEAVAIQPTVTSPSPAATDEPVTPKLQPNERQSLLYISSLVLPMSECSEGPGYSPQAEAYDGDVSSDTDVDTHGIRRQSRVASRSRSLKDGRWKFIHGFK